MDVGLSNRMINSVIETIDAWSTDARKGIRKLQFTKIFKKKYRKFGY